MVGGVTHRKGLWRFGSVGNAKRLHVVLPPDLGSDNNRMSLCGVVIESWIDERTTPVCPKCKKLMEGGQ